MVLDDVFEIDDGGLPDGTLVVAIVADIQQLQSETWRVSEPAKFNRGGFYGVGLESPREYV